MRKEHIIKAMFIAVAVVMFMFFFSSEASAAWTACYEYTTYVSAYWDGTNYKYYDDCYAPKDYFCSGNTPYYYSSCPSHCTVGCGAPSCECTSGVCCDGCNYRSTSYACGGPYYEYGCPWGTSCGADGGYRYRYRYCSGSSSSCTGSYGSWSSWYVNDSCSSSEYCSGGYCYSQCSSGVCCDGCRYRSSSYSCDTEYEYNYGCPWGTSAGDDAGYQYRTRYRYCSGSSSSCTGSYGSWSSWSSWYTYDSCSTSEYCSGGNCITITCSYNPTGCDSILNCPDGSICDCDAECQNACDFRYGSWGLCYTALKPIGESCTADSECDSGHCADGVCCNSSCTGVCRTCYFSSTYKGTCYYWNSDTDPDNECYGTGTCGGTCNGSGSCQYPAAGTDCGTCKTCNGSGSCASTPADDSDCGTIDCDGLDTYHQTGSDSPTGTDYCYYKNYNDLTSDRCEGFGDCKDANTTSDCTDYSDTLQYSCGTCKYAPSNYCTGSTKGSCANYAEGTSCGTNKECNGSGTCITCYYPTGSVSASKLTVETGETFTISVTGNDDHDVYYITYNKDSNIWNEGNKQKCSLTQTTCTRSWDITENVSGTYTYYGWVQDSDNSGGHGCSSDHKAGIGSVTVTVTQVDPPTARTDPATNVEETTARLHGAVTDTGGADYRVRFNYGDTSSYGSNSSWTDYYSYTISFYLDISGLTRGKTYHFRIEGQNSAGYGYGSDRTFITKPNPPSSFTATAVSESQINLSWSKGSGAYYTMVRRKTGSYPTSPSDGAQVYYGTGTSKSDTGLTTGTTYYYSAWSRGYEEGYYQYSDTYVTVSETATTSQRDCDLACKNLGYPGGYCAARDWAREQCVLGGYSSEVVDIGFQGKCVVPPLLIGSCQCCQPMINTRIDCAFSNCIFDKTSVAVGGQVAVGGYLKTTDGTGIAGEYLSLWMWNGTEYEKVTEDGMDDIGPTNSSGYASRYWTPSEAYTGTNSYVLFFAGDSSYNGSQTTNYSLTVIAVCPGPDNLRWGPINGIFYSGQFKILWDPVATASTYRLEWCEEGYSFGDSGCCPDYPNCYRVTSNTETDVYNLTPCKRYSWRVRVASATGCGTPGEWSNLVMPYAICPGCALGYFPGYECGFIESQSAASCILGYNNSLVGGSAFKANCYDTDTLCMADKCPSLSNSPSPEYSSELQTYSDGAVCNANVPSLTLDFMRSRTGVWDASEYKCIRCSGKFEDKICGDETKLYASVDTDVCTKAGNGKCEAACGAATECDEKNPGDSCALGVCDTSCNCTGPDLIITNGWDDNGIVEYTIKNQGVGDAGESYTALYIKDTTDNWVYKANDYEAALSAGASRGYGSANQSFPTYTLANRATDCAGRAEMPVSVCADYYGPRVDESNEGNNCFEFTVTCDATPPTATITTNPSPTNNWFRDDFTAQFEFRDSGGSGLAVCQYKIECDGWTTGWLNKPCSGNGPVNASRVVGVGAGEECNAQGYDACKIYAHVEDGAGNSPPNPEEAYGIDYEAPTTE